MLFAALHSALRLVLELIQLERKDAADLKAEVLAVGFEESIQIQDAVRRIGAPVPSGPLP